MALTASLVSVETGNKGNLCMIHLASSKQTAGGAQPNTGSGTRSADEACGGGTRRGSRHTEKVHGDFLLLSQRLAVSPQLECGVAVMAQAHCRLQFLGSGDPFSAASKQLRLQACSDTPS